MYVSGDIEELWSDAIGIMEDGIRDSTKQTYKVGQKDFLQFCNDYGLIAVPASEEAFMMYVTHLYKCRLKFNTIKVYVFAVRHVHIIQGYYNPLKDKERFQYH